MNLFIVPHFRELCLCLSLTPMAALVKLHLCPESFNNLCFRDPRRTTSIRRGRFGHDGASLKVCRAFRAEDGGDLKEKKCQNLKKNEVKLESEKGFWSSINSIMLSTFKLATKSDDEHRLAVAKVEEVLSSVSCLLRKLLMINLALFLLEFLTWRDEMTKLSDYPFSIMFIELICILILILFKLAK